ncbi:MAG: PIN domain-containing protein [Salinisphaera sp.]|nr:PIN domain-containing protein [Salinisphaera sp.]
MSVILDTGALYALFDADDRHHAAFSAFVQDYPGRLVVPVTVLSEIDYLLGVRLNQRAQEDFLADVVDRVYTLEPVGLKDIKRAGELLAQYKDLQLGLVDTSIMAVAERLRVRDILTTDLRDFRAVTASFGAFRLLPFDAET